MNHVNNLSGNEKVFKMIKNLKKDLKIDYYLPDQIRWRENILIEAEKQIKIANKKQSSYLPIYRMIKHRYQVGLNRDRRKYGPSKKDLQMRYNQLNSLKLKYKNLIETEKDPIKLSRWLTKSKNYKKQTIIIKKKLDEYTYPKPVNL